MVTQGNIAPDFTLETDRGTTVIVGADGRIKKVFENVTPQGHAEEVLAAL
jgi:peroxiredoxin